jgi:hypothetical protein
MHRNHLPSPGLCKVFELGVDRANEVELLFAPLALELFFSSDGCANDFVAFKVERALAPIGRSETFQRALLMLHDAQIRVAGDANVKVPEKGQPTRATKATRKPRTEKPRKAAKEPAAA